VGSKETPRRAGRKSGDKLILTDAEPLQVVPMGLDHNNENMSLISNSGVGAGNWHGNRGSRTCDPADKSVHRPFLERKEPRRAMGFRYNCETMPIMLR
jgi:hypothetical protein